MPNDFILQTFIGRLAHKVDQRKSQLQAVMHRAKQQLEFETEMRA